ncbi:MAG: hypothetical protein AAF846_18780 [Chloroflexota bacterium]
MNKTILINCIGILVDGQVMRQCYRHNMSQVMSARYGQSPDFWQTVDQKIVADWASYHADLNFSGDDGIIDMYEALFRTTRALFTIGNVPEPEKPEITALANELIATPCDNSVILPDSNNSLSQLTEKGYRVGVFAHLLETHLKAITTSLKMIDHHIGADTVSHYEHDQTYFLKVASYLKTPPEQITVITRHATTAQSASQAGLKSILVEQFSALSIDSLEN